MAEYDIKRIELPNGDICNLSSAGQFTVTSSETGQLVHFEDGADGIPMKQLFVNIEPKQSGSGDPSPSNIRPITGWENVKVTRTGRNLLDIAQGELGYIKADGTFTPQTGAAATNLGFNKKWRLLANYAYTVSVNASVYNIGTCIYTMDETVIARANHNNVSSFTIPPAAEERILGVWVDKNQQPYSSLDEAIATISELELQLEIGTARTTYEPYQGTTITISLGSTVYGGTLDVTHGMLTVDRVAITKTLSQRASQSSLTNCVRYNFANFAPSAIKGGGAVANETICTMLKYAYNTTDSPHFYVTSSNTAHFWVPSSVSSSQSFTVIAVLATPTIVYLTPRQVTTLLKNNNVWSDAGSVDLTYYKNTQVSYELSDKLGWKSLDQFERLRPEQTWQLDGVSNSQGMACDGTYIYVTHREDAVPTTPMKISRYLLPDMTYVDTHTVGTGHYNNLYYYEGKLYASGGSHYLDSENNPKDDYSKVAVVNTTDWSYDVKDSPDNWGIGVRKFRNYQGWNGKTGTEGAPDPNKGYITALWASSRRDIMFYASYFTDPTNKQTPLTRITLDYTGCTSIQGSFHMTDYYFWTIDTAFASGNTQSGHQVLRCFSYSGMLVKAFYLDGVDGVVGELEDLWVSDDDRTCYINTIDGRIFKFALPNLYHTLASTIYVGNTLKPGTIKHVYSHPQRRDFQASWPRGNYGNTVTGAFYLSDFTFLYEVGTFIPPTLWVNDRPLKGTFNEGYGTLWFQGSYNWTGGGRLSYAFRFTRGSDDPYNYYYYLSKFIANGRDDSTSPSKTININATSDGSFSPGDPVFDNLKNLYENGWLFGDMYIQDLSYIIGIPNRSTDLGIIN